MFVGAQKAMRGTTPVLAVGTPGRLPRYGYESPRIPGGLTMTQDREYRVVKKDGQPVYYSNMPTIFDPAVAEAGGLWSDHVYPSLGPHRVESRIYRDDQWVVGSVSEKET